MQTDLDRASAFIAQQQANQAVPIAADELARLRESHAALLASLRWALRRIDASGLGQGEYFARAGDAVATAENLRP